MLSNSTKLAELKELGVLTEEEFSRVKLRLVPKATLVDASSQSVDERESCTYETEEIHLESAEPFPTTEPLVPFRLKANEQRDKFISKSLTEDISPFYIAFCFPCVFRYILNACRQRGSVNESYIYRQVVEINESGVTSIQAFPNPCCSTSYIQENVVTIKHEDIERITVSEKCIFIDGPKGYIQVLSNCADISLVQKVTDEIMKFHPYTSSFPHVPTVLAVNIPGSLHANAVNTNLTVSLDKQCLRISYFDAWTEEHTTWINPLNRIGRIGIMKRDDNSSGPIGDILAIDWTERPRKKSRGNQLLRMPTIEAQNIASHIFQSRCNLYKRW